MDPPLHSEGAASPALRTDQQIMKSKTSNSLISISNQSLNVPVYFKDGSTPEHSLERSDSPEPSCVSMRSEESRDLPFANFKHGSTYRPIQEEKSDSPRCMKSVKSIDPIHFNERTTSEHSSVQQEISLKIDVLLQCRKTLKSNLIQKFQHLYGVSTDQGISTPFHEIYTELYITEGGNEEITFEHEVRQIETATRRTVTQDTEIKCNNIFRPLPQQSSHMRTVLTKGIAGIGKTVSVQKFILDWAEGKANQDVHFIFPLPFRELNLMKDKKLSLMDLLYHFFMEIKDMEIGIDEYKVVFIFDGLDECRLSLDFQSNAKLCDVTESASVDVLLTNLIRGNLIPSALIWITSRPAAADRIPSECVDRVTEVRGFNDPQKEEYFRKRISDESLANRIITHLKSSRSLYIMCHIPVFCWISATVLERMLSEAESGEIPKTLTQMYTHYLIMQLNIKNEKGYEKRVKDEEIILKLGNLAFKHLVGGNLIFYEEDLRDCGIDVTEASVYSGLCTQIFREEFGLYQGKVFCFVHLSIQEHLAALYVHHSFTNNNINVFDEPTNEETNTQISISDLHQRAVDEALKSTNGHLDLFLRFLLGFSLESNQTLLQGLLTQTGSSSNSKEETIKYIKKKIEENPTPEKFINLFHCLNDLGDDSLMEDIQSYLTSRALMRAKFTPLQWSAVVFVLMTSEHLDVFELKKYTWKTNCSHMTQVLQNLLPVVKASTSAQLSDCGLTEKSCVPLAKALSSESSCLRELNLNENKLKDSGMKLLSEGLENLHCKLEILRLKDCSVKDEGCAALASALRLNPSHLRLLDLSHNNLGDSGVKLLCAALVNPNWKLETLKLNNCGVTDEGCAALASALRSNPSHLRELDLSHNRLKDFGVKRFSDGLQNPHCKVEILRLKDCGLTDEGCAALASALKTNTNLKELDLTGNKLGNLGVNQLSSAPKKLFSKLEAIWLNDCGVTNEGCAALASALRSNLSKLRELNLANNNLGDSGVKLLAVALEDPHCKLESLGLNDCDVTDESVDALALALRSNPSHLRKLHLFGNKLGDASKKLLFDLQADPYCELGKFNVGKKKNAPSEMEMNRNIRSRSRSDASQQIEKQ